MGPVPPASPATTQPATQAAAREPAATQPAAATQAAITPATTAPATQAAATQPASTWVFHSGGNGDAEDGQVKVLLDALHPLKAEKYLEQAPATQPSATYRLTVHTAAASGTTDYIFSLIDPGSEKPLIGSYQDLTFEIERAFAAKLDGDFKTKK